MALTITRPAEARFDGLLEAFRSLRRQLGGWTCAREAERLSAMSDAELARQGLTRDRIFEHAFAPLLP